MMGVKMVFPGPHLHPDDLLDLMQLEPPTLSLGVPTIWMGLIQAYEAALTQQPGRCKLPAGMRSLVGGAAVPEALIRAFDTPGIWILQGWGMTETSPVCTISYPKAELRNAPMDERYRRAAMAGARGDAQGRCRFGKTSTAEAARRCTTAFRTPCPLVAIPHDGVYRPTHFFSHSRSPCGPLGKIGENGEGGDF
jgi:acyl-CoA synthetase (AMP-forming)/AMP-acid ligase II